MSLIACGALFFEDFHAIGKGEQQKCKTSMINVRDCRQSRHMCLQGDAFLDRADTCVSKETHSDTLRQSRHMCLQGDTLRHS